MKLTLIRHGETMENAKGIVQGHYDSRLNKNGLDQAKLLAQRLSKETFEVLFTSDLQRAYLTGERILDYHPGIPLFKENRLRERSYGILDNTKKKDMVQKHGITTEKEWYKLLYTAPGAETDRMCYTRAKKVIDEFLHSGYTNVCLVTHGGFIRFLYLNLEGIGFAERNKQEHIIHYGNTSVSKYIHTGGSWKQLLLNDTCHLDT